MSAAAPAPKPSPAIGLTALFALTIFLSAYLLFQVQPLISKLILPWYGGSPTVWTAAMLFFQTLLCAGYLYAHGLARLSSARVAALTHLVVLALAAWAAWSIVPGDALRPRGDEAPLASILLLLAATVGLPYFCLSTTGPLIQHWYARAGGGGSTYRLFALSNIGSFLALLSFPYVFEPWLSMPELAGGWGLAFTAFAVLAGAVAWHSAREPARPAQPTGPDAPSALGDAASATALVSSAPTPPGAWRRLAWLALPALASLAFIATTDQLSHNVAPEPKVWVWTLGLYLLTFVICFDHARWYQRGWMAPLAAVAMVALAARDTLGAWTGLNVDLGLSAMRAAHLVTLFLVCLVCHGELYRLRPSDERLLTGYYLTMSVGGALGGLFVALVATNMFSDYHEWPGLLVAALLMCAMVWRSAAPNGRPSAVRSATAAAGALAGIGLVLHALGVMAPGAQAADGRRLLDQARNFYGTVSVEDRRFPDDPRSDYRVFRSGGVTHGVQLLTPELQAEPTTYYGRESGVGVTLRHAMQRQERLRVALVGVGIGTVAAYARPADAYDFYEINPEVLRMAKQWFGNLNLCKAGQQRTFLGDARLKMAELGDHERYDVIVLDAFSGGSVPVHLLTAEAFALYRRLLADGGVIAVNITNSYLNLYPVIRRQAEHLGMGYTNRFQQRDQGVQARNNHWVMVSADAQFLQAHPPANRQRRDEQGRVVSVDDPDLPGVPLWTDHFSSLTPIELRY